MKRIIGFVGSPRKGGNTEILVKQVLTGAAQKGANVRMFNLTRLNIHGCRACCRCQKSGRCVQKDGMQRLYDEIFSAGAIVLGSPVYMGHVTGQAKLFLDRLFALMKPDMTSRLPGVIPVVLVFAQGDPNIRSYAPAFKITADMLNFLGFQVTTTLVVGGLQEAGAVRKRSRAMARARKAGAALAAQAGSVNTRRSRK